MRNIIVQFENCYHLVHYPERLRST